MQNEKMPKIVERRVIFESKKFRVVEKKNSTRKTFVGIGKAADHRLCSAAHLRMPIIDTFLDVEGVDSYIPKRALGNI